MEETVGVKKLNIAHKKPMTLKQEQIQIRKMQDINSIKYETFLKAVLPLFESAKDRRRMEFNAIAPMFFNNGECDNDLFIEFSKILFNSELEFNEEAFNEEIKKVFFKTIPSNCIQKHIEIQKYILYTELNLTGEVFSFLNKYYNKKLNFLLKNIKKFGTNVDIIERPGTKISNLIEVFISAIENQEILKKIKILKNFFYNGKLEQCLFKDEICKDFEEKDLKKQIVTFFGINQYNYKRISKETDGFIVSLMPTINRSHVICIVIDLSKLTYKDFMEELLKEDTKSIISFDPSHYGYLNNGFCALTKTLFKNSIVPIMQSSPTCGYHTIAAIKVLVKKKSFTEIRAILNSELSKKEFQYEYSLELIKIMGERLDLAFVNFESITKLEQGITVSEFEFKGLSKANDIYSEIGFTKPAESKIVTAVRSEGINNVLQNILSEIKEIVEEAEKIKASKDLLESIIETRIKQMQLFSFSVSTAEKRKQMLLKKEQMDNEVGSVIDGEFVNRLRIQEMERLKQSDAEKVLRFK